MANEFKITISAADKATSVIKGVNAAVAKVTRPIADIGKASKAIAKEAGFDKLGTAIGKVRSVADQAAKSLGVMRSPIALLGGAGTLAGVAALADEIGRYGIELTNTAAAAGTSAAQLSRMRGAAQLAGVSGATAASALTNLNNVLEDAQFGRNMLALSQLNKEHISLHKNARGQVDTMRALYDILDAISRQKTAGAQNKLASIFGVEGLLTADVRSRGAAALRERERLAQATGEALSPAQTAQANAFGRSLAGVRSAVAGVGNAIEFDLMPWMQPLADGFTKWEMRNRSTAAHMTEIGGAAGIAAGGIAALSGALAGLGAIGATLATGGIALAVGGLAAAAVYGAKKLTDVNRDLAKSGVILDPEMGLIPMPGGGGSTAPASPGGRAPRGIRQNNPLNLRSWGTAPIVDGYASFATPQEGIDAAAKQLLLYQGRGIDTLAGIASTWAPAADHNNVGAYVADLSRQTGFGATQHLDLRDPTVLASVLSAMIRHENGQDPYGRRMIDAEAQKVTVEVQFHNAPPGTTATARTAGARVPLAVHYSMPVGEMP
ncbi:MAG: hypothetical protein KGJ66_04240 [Alphaproteobacteria bacterium]|nr:hypothetical protein [Alphaproteobacteria bacterium]